jgi:hypothetical protein
MKTPRRIRFWEGAVTPQPTGGHPHQQSRLHRWNISLATCADWGAIDLSNTLSAKRGQRTETTHRQRKDYYVNQSQNPKGLQIGQP